MNVTFETVICAWDEKIPAMGHRTKWFNYG